MTARQRYVKHTDLGRSRATWRIRADRANHLELTVYVKVAGLWRYVYRAVDGYGQVIDVFVSFPP